MKTMKKIVSIGICIAMLTGAALAEDNMNVGSSSAETGWNNQMNQQVQPPQMPGMNGQDQQDQPPAMLSAGQNNNQQNGQPPQMPGMNGQDQQDQPSAMPSAGQNNNQQNGQPPQIPGMNGQDQQGQPPAMPSDEQNGEQQNGQLPQMPGLNGQDQQGQPAQMPGNGYETENNGTAVVQTGNSKPLRMRQEPTTKGRIMDQLSNGTQVEILEVQNDWVRIRVNDKEGYVMIKFLEGNLQEQQGNEQSGDQQGQPPQMPGNQPGGMPGGMPEGMNAPTDYSAAATVTENSNSADYSSTANSENAVLVSGSAVTISNATVSKTGSSDSGEADFYGINATVLAKDGATLTVEGTTITSDGTHANGVFSYGQGTTVNVSDTSITTTGNNSGGLMTTGGATLNATNVTVSTSGNSSAAIRSDRGGGTVNVSGGSYTSSGIGSPAIYSTADISVSNATLASSTSEAVVIEGGNTVNLTDVSISGSNSTLNGQSTIKTNVLIYQSMSGDASEGASSFTMTGGNMVSETGSMFHVTNTTTTINLDSVDFTYAADSNVFLDASADSWGRTGSNGGNVTLNLTNQSISGVIISDSVSSVSVSLDSNSTWTLQGDSYISSFSGDLTNVDLNGYTLFVDGTEVTR